MSVFPSTFCSYQHCFQLSDVEAYFYSVSDFLEFQLNYHLFCSMVLSGPCGGINVNEERLRCIEDGS